MNDLQIGILIGAIVGGFLAWAVTTWRLNREPHCLDCECEGCTIVRGGIHGPSDSPTAPSPAQVPVMKAIPGGMAVREFTEALRKVGRPE